jgi:hypothetical protein
MRQERQVAWTRDTRQEDKRTKGQRGQTTRRQERHAKRMRSWNGLTNYIRTSALLFSYLLVFISCVVVTIHYPSLKGKNIAMDEQNKNNTDHAVAETVDTYPAPPAEVTVEKEGEAAAPAEVTVEKEAEAPPPAEVIDPTKRTNGNG